MTEHEAILFGAAAQLMVLHALAVNPEKSGIGIVIGLVGLLIASIPYVATLL